jgi:RND superfamily putative drug exporter
VQRDPKGFSAFEQVDALWRTMLLNRNQLPGLERVGGAFVVSNTLGQPPFSREASTTALTYLLFAPTVDQGDRRILAQRLIDGYIEPEYEGFVGSTGAIAARAEQAEAIEEALPAVEIATVLLVALVVGWHFRALGAPLATLAAVGLAYLISIRAIAAIGKEAGFSVPSEVEPVGVVLLFGVVTDYSIFFLSRIRRRLADGEDAQTATIAGTAELLPIICAAGLTVTAAAASLVVAQLGFFQAFGPVMALSLLVGLLVAISFVPALLAIGGRWLFWPRRPGVDVPAREAAEETPTERRGRPARHRAVELAASRPVATIVACGALLLAAASGLAQVDLGNPLIRGLPAGSPPKEAYAQASKGFAPGILSPTVVLVEGRGIVTERRALAALQRLLEDQPGVAEVVGPGDQPSNRLFGAVLSKTGDAARFFVVLNADPLGARGIDSLRGLRDKMPWLLHRAGLPRASASYAGDTALVSETIDQAIGDIGRVAPVALLVVLLVMAVFLRALVAPLYLLAASVLALLAALGLTTYVFQGLAGQEGLAYFVPFAAAVLLLSLGSDYNVFLTGRIWQEAARRPLREAVRVAGARAATPITIAGIVLAGSFALLFLVPIRPFQQLGFAMAAGLLIDAFLVRTLLVPALIVLVGPRSGWPGRRLRGAKHRRSLRGADSRRSPSLTSRTGRCRQADRP